MWLLDTSTFRLHFVAKVTGVPSMRFYHTSGLAPESRPFNLKTPPEQDAPSWDDERVSAKIRNCCALARRFGYDFVWIDSCCIDKTSSAELSEAINSMYEWYSKAGVCFAFMEDVDGTQDPLESSTFRASRWFTRGWTLQELIAPRKVVFLSGDWHIIGSKDEFALLIEDITSIDRAILPHKASLSSVDPAHVLGVIQVDNSHRGRSLLSLGYIRPLHDHHLRRGAERISSFAGRDHETNPGPDPVRMGSWLEAEVLTAERGSRRLSTSCYAFTTSSVLNSKRAFVGRRRTLAACVFTIRFRVESGYPGYGLTSWEPLL
ncbi:hypothetical protein BN946_scf184569.g5 [Trametes cinnabarina]|uniref:Heterokaryon incompatibility domain-containing protein n=1 Tax=Pycnoporus cinnabarinus TaxID=5643 RepID=A0A060S7J0_PYCCI|nr:hypothetical protein BN946_scf184569.g5 [Trametes cinnabarina]